MNKVYIDPNKCDRSVMCQPRRSCPEKAITQEKLGLIKRGVAVIDLEKCVACGECIKLCPHGAILMKEASVGQRKKKKKK